MLCKVSPQSLFTEYPSAKLNQGQRGKGVFKRGEAPLLNIPPPPLPREGDKGRGLPNKKFKKEQQKYGADFPSSL